MGVVRLHPGFPRGLPFASIVTASTQPSHEDSQPPMSALLAVRLSGRSYFSIAS
jgi:hypothetical protein